MTDNKCSCEKCNKEKMYKKIIDKQKKEIEFLKEKLTVFREHYYREEKYL